MMVVGSKYGYVLLWFVIVGCIMKVILVEGVGCYSFVIGNIIFEGWSSFGCWMYWYFGFYIVIWGFVYGVVVMVGIGLVLYLLFLFFSVVVWGILLGFVGVVLVWLGCYDLFEKVLIGMVILMFIIMVIVVVLILLNIFEIMMGFVLYILEGVLINVFSVVGGVGGMIMLVVYGYWLWEKGWIMLCFMCVMWLDNGIVYVVIGIFVVVMLIVGVEFLYLVGIVIGLGDQGMVDLVGVLGDCYGIWMLKLFLVGFWVVLMLFLVGVWNGVSLMFVDFFGYVQGKLYDDFD